MKKKMLSMVLALAMAAGLTACGSSSSSSTTTTAAATEAATEAAAEAAAETVAEGAETETADLPDASGDPKVMMDLATAYAADAPAGKALQKFVDDVAEKSGGSIEISLFTDGTLGNASDNYASVANGDLDMTMTGLEGLDLYAPEYTFLDAPFLIKSWDHLNALLNGGIGDKLKERYEENGFVTLGFHARDVRELASNTEVTSPDQVKGLKLRLPGMTVYVDTWSALGASPTQVAMSELYTALQTKVADACEGGYEQMTTLKLYEVQKYIAETDHVYEFVGLYINKDKLASLTEAQQTIIKACATECLAYADELSESSRAEYKQTCIDGGMTFVEIDRDTFHEALKDYYNKQFEEKWTVSSYDEVMSYAQ